MKKKMGKPEREWLQDLFAAGYDYDITVLEAIDDPSAPGVLCTWWTGINATALNDAERWWIAWGRENGWPLTNQTDGGEGTSGFKHSEASRAANSARNKLYLATPENNPMFGKNHSRDTKAKISAGNKGKTKGIKRSAEHCAKIGAAHKGKIVSKETRKKQSERHSNMSQETKDKMSSSAKARWTTPEAIEFMKGSNNPSRRPGVGAKISATKKAKAAQKPPTPCGSVTAYRKALIAKRDGLPSCGPCSLCKRAAADEASNARHARFGKPKAPLPCGTPAAHRRAFNARKQGKPNCGPCELCRRANADYQKTMRLLRLAKKP